MSCCCSDKHTIQTNHKLAVQLLKNYLALFLLTLNFFTSQEERKEDAEKSVFKKYILLKCTEIKRCLYAV